MQDDDGDEEEAAREVAKAAGGADDDDDRALCPDGSCTGLLDIDGRCKVCGKVDESVRSRVKATPARDADRGDDADGADGGDEGDAGDDDDRQLCPDGACTGLIGNDGACRVCGRRIEA